MRLACQNAAWQAKAAAEGFAAHPDLGGVAKRLQIDTQAVCSKMATRSIEAAQSLKQIVDDLDLNQAAEIVKEEGVAAARKVQVLDLEDAQAFALRCATLWSMTSGPCGPALDIKRCY